MGTDGVCCDSDHLVSEGNRISAMVNSQIFLGKEFSNRKGPEHPLYRQIEFSYEQI